MERPLPFDETRVFAIIFLLHSSSRAWRDVAAQLDATVPIIRTGWAWRHLRAIPCSQVKPERLPKNAEMSVECQL